MSLISDKLFPAFLVRLSRGVPMVKLELDKQSSKPLVEQLVESFEEWIARNGGGGGSRLPSIRHLAAEHGISRNVVIEAYERLVAHGLVRSRPGSGFYVAATAPVALAKAAQASGRLEDFTSDMWNLFQADEDHLKLGCGWLPNHWRESDDLPFAKWLGKAARASSITARR